MELTGIILAGGKSSRMGEDKGLAMLRGKRMIEYVIETIKESTNNIIIISNNLEYSQFGYPVFSDLIIDCGPMGGIYTGLKQSKTKFNLVLSCDMPFINSKIINYLIHRSVDFEITVPLNNGKIEPLCGIYKKSCSGLFLELLLKKKYKIYDSFKYFKVEMAEISELFLNPELVFMNVNSKNDFINASLYHEN